jgi:hypothetical protein
VRRTSSRYATARPRCTGREAPSRSVVTATSQACRPSVTGGILARASRAGSRSCLLVQERRRQARRPNVCCTCRRCMHEVSRLESVYDLRRPIRAGTRARDVGPQRNSALRAAGREAPSHGVVCATSQACRPSAAAASSRRPMRAGSRSCFLSAGTVRKARRPNGRCTCRRFMRQVSRLASSSFIQHRLAWQRDRHR